MPCSVSSITDTQLLCNVGEHAGGTFPVIFHHKVKGYALTQSVFAYELLLTGVTPNEGNSNQLMWTERKMLHEIY